MGSFSQNLEDFISTFGNQLFDHSFILCPLLREGNPLFFVREVKGLSPKMGYKRRGAKQSIKI